MLHTFTATTANMQAQYFGYFGVLSQQYIILQM